MGTEEVIVSVTHLLAVPDTWPAEAEQERTCPGHTDGKASEAGGGKDHTTV